MFKHILAFIISIIIASFSQILLKKGTKKSNIYINIYTIMGYLLMILSTLLTLYGYKQVSLLFSQILQSMSYLFVMIFSELFLGEKITKKMLLGIFIILISVIIYTI